MSAPLNESGTQQELAPSALAAAAPAVPQAQMALQSKTSMPPVAAVAAGGGAPQSIQSGATPAVAEVMYHLRGIGMAAAAGVAAGVVAAAPFIVPDLPPGAPVAGTEKHLFLP